MIPKIRRHMNFLADGRLLSSWEAAVFYKRIHLFNLLGFRVWIDFSWLIIAVLITWSLANTFPHYYPDLSTIARWSMGIAGVVGLFASIVLHELSHSLVARGYEHGA